MTPCDLTYTLEHATNAKMFYEIETALDDTITSPCRPATITTPDQKPATSSKHGSDKAPLFQPIHRHGMLGLFSKDAAPRGSYQVLIGLSPKLDTDIHEAGSPWLHLPSAVPVACW
ncbi:unnamed protein product [Diplocarpon coronariae]|nr:hypothetical protein JHW43_001775 [Diplocarpon mali]